MLSSVEVPGRRQGHKCSWLCKWVAQTSWLNKPLFGITVTTADLRTTEDSHLKIKSRTLRNVYRDTPWNCPFFNLPSPHLCSRLLLSLAPWSILDISFSTWTLKLLFIHNGSYEWLRVTMWVLGIKPLSCARSNRYINHWAISLAPHLHSQFVVKCVDWPLHDMSITGFQDKLHFVVKYCHLWIAGATLVNICLGFYIHESFFSLQGKADLIEKYLYSLSLSVSLCVCVSLF